MIKREKLSIKTNGPISIDQDPLSPKGGKQSVDLGTTLLMKNFDKII